MPDFVMEGRDHAARAESDFVLGYLEAAFFTADDDLSECGYADLAPAALAMIRADCEAWQAQHAEALAFALAPMSGYCKVQAGRDFWFTRNGHGVGFWDREELRRDMARRLDGTLTDTGEEEGLPFLAALGEILSNAARAAGSVDLYRGDDGLIYVTP